MTKLLARIGPLRALTVALFAALSLSLPALADEVSLTPLTAQVETLRERHFLREVNQKTLPRAELRSFLEKQMEKDLPMPIDEYVGVLRALHLIGKGDGIGPMLDLYEAQVLAFYDPVSHVFYSLDKPPAAAGALPEAMQKAVIIHELTHALQDQLFNAGARMQGVQDDWDAQLAYQSVLEGEATLIMMGYLGETMGMKLEDMVSSPDLLKTLTAASSANAGVPETTPRYFVESLKFPYIAGIGFVIDAYKRQGWNGVDQIDRCPPTTTAEINDPALYWKIVASAGGIQANKSVGNTSSLGVFHWDFLLGQGASTGWMGDRVEVQRPSSKEPTVLVETRWDSPKHARDFQHRYEEFLKSQNEHPWSVVTGSTVRIAYGGDRTASQKFTRNKNESKVTVRPRQCTPAVTAGASK
ncbi:MAG TPA: hypothetical protein VHL58_15600 [Thermoanaerobaculia bacterium]|nr:hypothetical protein [Thermoanaerobaculia bacterium]